MNPVEKALRYVRTVRHLKMSQVLWRLRYALTARLSPIGPLPKSVAVDGLDLHALDRLRGYALAVARREPPEESRLAALRTNTFTFLNHTVQHRASTDWYPKGTTRLWQYHLHSFGFARDVAIGGSENPSPEVRDIVYAWMRDWIEKNPMRRSPAWDAYVLSSRMLNWAQTFAVFGPPPKDILASFALQTSALLQRLEWDIRANHLLKNALALSVAGALFGSQSGIGAAASRAGNALLKRELAEQILADGGHYERSAMYHCEVLENCLIALAAQENPLTALRDAISRMTGFLSRVLHTDGEIPLFGDAALGEGISAGALVGLASEIAGSPHPEREANCHALASSGFYVLQKGDGAAGRMIVKAGEPGPSYQLGHAHCDMLSFEFSRGAARLLVDSGVRGYDDDVWRAYCRGTASHNTVRVNGREQMECWDRFRVGRRYRPAIHGWGEREEGWVLRGSHDGFRPWTHERTVLLAHGGFWLIADRVTGPGRPEVESFLHVHPGVSIAEMEGGWSLANGGERVSVVPFGFRDSSIVKGSDSPKQGWYCPRFGVALPAPCLVLRISNDSPIRCGYGIFPHPGDVLDCETLGDLVRRLMESGT
ncbi:MAG: alginate lyase family protein [Candidatus Hydrogenedentes bacterium]|nr:alginate lyase family protein [Candidatus Hydrogenedentota bacterium]